MVLEQALDQALNNHCSDIHITVANNESRLFLRRYGKLNLAATWKDGQTFVNRLKIRANLDIGESRKRQEGQFQYRRGGESVSVRVSIIGTTTGEKIALRLLPPTRLRSLDQLGMHPPLRKALQESLSKPSGLVLVCGATGAGKTTTLYAGVNYLNDGQRTIYTIEDPVEVPIKGTYQCETNDEAGIDSPYLLKSFMRQDPDVIMVGEIRDKTTAELAISAALTGHLVLATLHANTPLGAIQRLQLWQIDFFSLASVLNLVIHQNMAHDDLHGYLPSFTAIAPLWKERLPKGYAALIEETEQWHFFGAKYE